VRHRGAPLRAAQRGEQHSVVHVVHDERASASKRRGNQPDGHGRRQAALLAALHAAHRRWPPVHGHHGARRARAHA
jgi:hypothetical protein